MLKELWRGSAPLKGRGKMPVSSIRFTLAVCAVSFCSPALASRFVVVYDEITGVDRKFTIPSSVSRWRVTWTSSSINPGFTIEDIVTGQLLDTLSQPRGMKEFSFHTGTFRVKLGSPVSKYQILVITLP